MPSFSDIGVSQPDPSTITMRVGTVTLTRNSTLVHQDIISLGDPDSTNGLAAVLSTTPASTAWALVVREVVPQSTGPFVISSIVGITRTMPNDTNWASSAGFHFDSSGALNIKDTTLPSTGPIVISSIVGITRVMPSDTNWASSAGFHFDSSGALNIKNTTPGSTDVTISAVAVSTVAQNSSNYLPVRLTDGSSFLTPGSEYTDGSTASSFAGPTVLFNNGSNATMRMIASTTPLPTVLRNSTGTEVVTSTAINPNFGDMALVVAQKRPLILSTRILVNIGTGGGSTTLVSSGSKINVIAYSVTSTIVAYSSVAFLSSGAERWGFILGTGSSGITGANLSIGIPAYLFAADAGEALGFSASSTGLYSVSITYFTTL